MTQKSAFLIQFLEKLGLPLVQAVAQRSGGQEMPATDNVEEAGQVVALLSQSVQTGLALGEKFDLQDAGDQADSIRLALAALIAPLVAHQYGLNDKPAADIDTANLLKSLESILAFADNFTPAADNTMRLEGIEGGYASADENQITIQYIAAMIPVINAVADFSFGLPEQKLAQDIAQRLSQRAETLRHATTGGAPDLQSAKQAELQILKTLATLYAQTHHAETQRLSAMDEKARAQAAEGNNENAPMNRVWESFETRVKMAEVLGQAQNIASSTHATTGGGTVTPPPPADPAPPVAAPQAPAVKTPPPQESSAQQEVSDNPMGFFKPGQKPVAQPQEQAAAQPSAPPPTQPAAQTPPAAAPETPAAPPQEDAPQDGSYNPMGFFKPGGKPDETIENKGTNTGEDGI